MNYVDVFSELFGVCLLDVDQEELDSFFEYYFLFVPVGGVLLPVDFEAVVPLEIADSHHEEDVAEFELLVELAVLGLKTLQG